MMKYVCDHATTLDALRSWAGSEKLFTASYFFWNAGLPIQKSQNGLLQSLLYQILRACPALTLQMCPLHYAHEPWTRGELFETLEKIAKQTVLSAKFCFFIDGLDEYEGDDFEVIALLESLTSSSSVKICASSRPWNAFMDAFDNSEWKLVLEDLTKNDMRSYVHEMLVEDEVFAKVAREDPRCHTLVPQIADKAQGVWLWVYLVVRDLLRDLQGEEAFPHLQRRLDSFPDELEKYFADILDRIDRVYREETAKIFLLVVEALRPIPLLFLSFLDMEGSRQSFATLDMTPMSSAEAQQLGRKWRKRLNSRCRDLLEVHKITGQASPLLRYNIEFLHRTVRDFLRDSYQDELQKRTGEHFDAKTSLCTNILTLIKLSPHQDRQSRPPDVSSTMMHESLYIPFTVTDLFELVDEFLYYVRDLERKTSQSKADLLDELDQVNKERIDGNAHWTNLREAHTYLPVSFEERGQCTFLALTIQAGLRLYVKEKIESSPTTTYTKRGRPLLDYALRPKRHSSLEILSQTKQEDELDEQIIRLLLAQGCNPNEEIDIYPGHTVWSLFLLHIYNHNDLASIEDGLFLKDTWYDTIELLVDHGANSQVRVRKSAGLPHPRPNLTSRSGRYNRYMVVVDEAEQNADSFTIMEILDSVFGRAKASRLEKRMEELAPLNQGLIGSFWRALGWG